MGYRPEKKNFECKPSAHMHVRAQTHSHTRTHTHTHTYTSHIHTHAHAHAFDSLSLSCVYITRYTAVRCIDVGLTLNLRLSFHDIIKINNTFIQKFQ